VEWFGALSGDVVGVNPEGAAKYRISWPALVAQQARAAPKNWDGTGRRRAPNVTHSVFWRTGVPKVMENITYFEHRNEAPKSVPKRDAPEATHTDIS